MAIGIRLACGPNLHSHPSVIHSEQWSVVVLVESSRHALTTDRKSGNCASTCAMFSTLMNERLQTKIAVFGGKPGENVEFKGEIKFFAGNGSGNKRKQIS